MPSAFSTFSFNILEKCEMRVRRRSEVSYECITNCQTKHLQTPNFMFWACKLHCNFPDDTFFTTFKSWNDRYWHVIVYAKHDIITYLLIDTDNISYKRCRQVVGGSLKNSSDDAAQFTLMVSLPIMTASISLTESCEKIKHIASSRLVNEVI